MCVLALCETGVTNACSPRTQKLSFNCRPLGSEAAGWAAKIQLQESLTYDRLPTFVSQVQVGHPPLWTDGARPHRRDVWRWKTVKKQHTVMLMSVSVFLSCVNQMSLLLKSEDRLKKAVVDKLMINNMLIIFKINLSIKGIVHALRNAHRWIGNTSSGMTCVSHRENERL